MESSLQTNKTCELHVHIGGCTHVQDMIRLGREIYQEVDWSPFQNAYEEAYAIRPDPVELFTDAVEGSAAAVDRLRQHYVYTPSDGPDFERFSAKFQLLICLARHLRNLGRGEEIITAALDHHRVEGVRYVEYRAMDTRGASYDPQSFLDFHRRNANAIQHASSDDFVARYIISLPRWEPLFAYELVQQLLAESPELIDTIVGLDFCHVEEGHPPNSAKPLFDRVIADNLRYPERKLGLVYHVGESFYDKSLESAVRWCHEAASMGAQRLGHCIALGLRPEIAVARQTQAHEGELISERIDQINYDIVHAAGLRNYAVNVDEAALLAEKKLLLKSNPKSFVSRPYDSDRLREVKGRQDHTMAVISQIGTVLEICPTSNLCLGGVPNSDSHPIHRFLESEVNLVISADDPGIFDSTLTNEVDWVLDHSEMDEQKLAKRLGDPFRFRLGQARV